MSFATPLTPTKNKANTSQIQVSSVQNMDDVNMLLYLDVLKKKADNELAISQKIDEAYKVYQKRRFEYFNLYSKYVKLLKLAATRKVLKESRLLPFHLTSATEDMKLIKEKLSSGSATDYIDTQELEQFKKMLCSDEEHANLKNLRLEMMDLKIATKAIQTAIESTEVAIDNGTNQGLDLFAEELDMENFPKISQLHDTEN